VAPGASFRDLSCHGMFFLTAKWLDSITEDLPDCEWRKQGGSEAYFREYLPFFFQNKQFAREKDSRTPLQLLSQLIADIGQYASSRSWVFDEDLQKDICLIAPKQQLGLWIKSGVQLGFTNVQFQSVRPVFENEGIMNKCVTVGNKQYKGAFLPLSCLGEEEIRLLCKALGRKTMQRYIDLLLSSLGGENSTSGAGVVSVNEALAVAEQQEKDPLAVESGSSNLRMVEGQFRKDTYSEQGSRKGVSVVSSQADSSSEQTSRPGFSLHLTSTGEHLPEDSFARELLNAPRKRKAPSSISTHSIVDLGKLSPTTGRKVSKAVKVAEAEAKQARGVLFSQSEPEVTSRRQMRDPRLRKPLPKY